MALSFSDFPPHAFNFSVDGSSAFLMEDEQGVELENKQVTTSSVLNSASHEAKLKELLHKINSVEIKLCSDATKEFIKLLKGNSGGELLHLYVQSTSNFSELFAALKLRVGKPGTHHILKLISVILGHPDGKFVPNYKGRISVSMVIDKFARSFIEEQHLDFVYKELVSKDKKRQNAALLLMANVVRRGSGLASEVANKFDFKLKEFSKLSEYNLRKKEKSRKFITRKAFVGFAMSFLEVGKPRLLRWCLQQRELYSGVLRGLADDDDETVMYVLSLLRDRVLNEESLIPPALRSVLFGSVVLEQLVHISKRGSGIPNAELAQNVLHMVCTDPSNGLMPDLKRRPNPLRGNPKRLLELMKKLKPMEAVYHRELLLAIVRGRLSLGLAYLEKFPYNLEDYESPIWFSSVSLAANLISLLTGGIPCDFFDSLSDDPPFFDSASVQNIIKIISSRALSRSMINKGLLHSNFLVKNGTLRLLLETLRMFASFFRAINLQKCTALEQEMQNEIQSLLPDPQVFLTILSPLSSHGRTNTSCLKRTTDKENFLVSGKRTKKLKTNTLDKDADIIIGGISSEPDDTFPSDGENVVMSQVSRESDSEMHLLDIISELWGFDQCCMPVTTLEDTQIFFHSKLLDALQVYLQIMPTALEGSFDFFMSLLNNASLPSNLLSSLLPLLVEYIRWSPGSGLAIRTPQMMYKHLQSFLNLLLFSPIVDIKDQAYTLARAAMSSTGAFDRNLHEIVAWFLFLPGYSTVKLSVETHGEELQSLSTVVVSFLCDAISTIGNNLFRHWHAVKNHTCHLTEFSDTSPQFSPLSICVLQKCTRLLSSESGTFSLPEKSMISAYVCNTLKYLLQTQVDARLLAALIKSLLSEGLQDHSSVDSFCEWQPLKNLLLMVESLLDQKTCCFFLINQKDLPDDVSFTRALGEIRKIVESGDSRDMTGIVKAFCSAIMCTTSDMVLKNFPTVMTISQHIGVPLSFLSSIVFHDPSFLSGVLKLWPKVFFAGLEKAVSMINPQGMETDAFAQDIMLNVDVDASEAAAVAAFGLFLRQAPFHVLFPTIISSNGPCLSEPSMIKGLLMAKLSECTSHLVVSYLQILLFWFYQIRTSYRIEQLAIMDEFAEICFILVKHMIYQLLVLKLDSGDPLSDELIQEMAKTILYHPSVKATLMYPLGFDDNSNNEEFIKGNFRGNLDAFFNFSRRKVHPIDHHVLDILTATFDYFLSPSGGQPPVLKVEDSKNKQLVKAFKTLMQSLYVELKTKFDLCIRIEDLLPLLQPFYALHALMQFTSPSELLELACWIFDRVDVNDLSVLNSFTTSALSIGFCIAADAFKILSIYLQQPVRTKATFCSFWEMEKKKLDIDLIEEIYITVCKFATNFGQDFAYSCLVEAVSAFYKQKYMKHDSLDPLSLVISRTILGTPREILSHCIYGTSKTKAELLHLLVEMSPLHVSVFGSLLSGILNRNCETSLSEEDFMFLLPAVCSYLNSIIVRLEKPYHRQFTDIISFYSKIILSGLHNWKSFVSGKAFEENYVEFLPSSYEELVNLVDYSLLGKALHMLKYHFALSGEMKMKERLKIFSCILTSADTHDELLDCDVDEIEFYSSSQLLNLINRVAGKILFCRMLLFPSGSQVFSLPKEADDLKEIYLEMMSKEGRSRLRFIQILVRAWQCMIKKFPPVSDYSSTENSSGCLELCRYLELLILRTILDLTREMRDGLIQLQSIPFLEQLMRSALLHRFEDPTTLNIIHSILTLLSQGKFSSVLYLQLLLAHSQFASTICSLTESHSCQTDAFFRPMRSILRSLVIGHSNYKNNLQRTNLHLKQLEIVKLLRTLVQLKPDEISCYSGQDMVINLKELHLLLLSSYGATLSEFDLEIFSLMHAIELIDNSVSEDLARMHYLWGNAVSKIRKERALDWDTSSHVMTNTEVLEEHRRSQFREVLPIEPKICATTVAYFPYDRILNTEPENPKNVQVAHLPGVGILQRYDPIFILRFSNHNLSTGYIEPLEFARLGLLAVAFISMSSPDIEIRKLSDASLGKFKDALERCQKKKDLLRLHLLLTYMQNGIKEKLQRIPSIIALFAAESSLILLDPSNDLFTTLSKHLMHSSTADMKHIPLFHTLFESNSVNFRAERLWMLRLVCAGLNSDDDAQIFISNSILEILLSFYATPLADNEARELILLVVKKSVKLDRVTRHLVERCGLFPWLSSILSISSVMLDENVNSFSSLQLVLSIEVVSDIISSSDIIESAWFKKYAFEQWIELASHLYKILVGGLKFIKENVALIESVLQIIISILKISQKQEIYQPHFTLSFEASFGIYQAFNAFCTPRSGPNAKSGLEAVLNSTPPVDIFHMSKEKLSGFLIWAVSTALKSDCENLIHLKKSHVSLMIISEETQSEESLASKLLRWLVAAVILGKLSYVNTRFSGRSSPETLQSFLECLEKRCGGSKNNEFDCEEELLATIFYLQQLIGLNWLVNSSVVSALSLLILSGASKCPDFMHDHRADVVSLWSKVRCPAEANPEWRWSFDKPWKDPKHEFSNLQKVDEYHASQTLLVIISNVLGKKKSLDSLVLSYQNLVNSEAFKWERRIVENNDN